MLNCVGEGGGEGDEEGSKVDEQEVTTKQINKRRVLVEGRDSGGYVQHLAGKKSSKMSCAD